MKFAAFAMAAFVAVAAAQAMPFAKDMNVTDAKKDQAARALFAATEFKVPGFYDALAKDAQFVKTVARTLLQQLAVDQAFAAEFYASSAAYVQTQAAVINSSPACSAFQKCLGI